MSLRFPSRPVKTSLESIISIGIARERGDVPFIVPHLMRRKKARHNEDLAAYYYYLRASVNLLAS